MYLASVRHTLMFRITCTFMNNHLLIKILVVTFCIVLMPILVLQKSIYIPSIVSQSPVHNILHQQVNPFKDRICKVFSSQDDDQLSFEDFLDMMSVFSDSCPKNVKVEYAFRIYGEIVGLYTYCFHHSYPHMCTLLWSP